MSGKSAVISVIVTGEADSAKKAFKETADAAEGMGREVREAGKGFDVARDAFDDGERRVVGFRDAVTGTGDVMKGFRDGDVVTLATGVADLASSFANLGVDVIKQAFNLAKLTATRVADTASVVASTVATTAQSAATAVWTGAQWALNAALSANPIALVVIAVVAFTAAIVLAWQHSETFREVVTGAFEAVKAVAMGAFNWVRDNWPLLLAILTGPIGVAVLAITKHFDTIKDGFRAAINFIIDGWNGLEFKMPAIDTHIPGVGKIGGFTVGVPDIPRLATGGITTGPMTALVGDNPSGREAIIPLDSSRGRALLGGGGPSIVIQGDVYGEADFLRKLEGALARLGRNGSTVMR